MLSTITSSKATRRRTPGDLLPRAEEQPVRELHDIGLVTSVTFLRPFFRAYSNAKRMMRSEPKMEMGLMEMAESSRTFLWKAH